MILLLDVGNTRIKWGWLRGAELLPGGAIVHAGRSPQAALDAVTLNAAPTGVLAASVAGEAMRAAVEGWAGNHWGLTVDWARSAPTACGVHNAYARPERLGVDRWLAMIAAYHRARGAAIVVDAGTALTIDVVDERGVHQGGLIAPGVETQRRALMVNTQLRAEDQGRPLGLLADDTHEAVNWGTLHGALGMIERVHGVAARDLAPMRGYLTGGEATLLAENLNGNWLVVPDLVLEGLALVSRETAAAPAQL
jgi:type III pantothenate kinase